MDVNRTGFLIRLLQPNRVVYSYRINKVVEELDRRLRQLDRVTAEQVERLVHDALALVGESAHAPASSQWPESYFERTAGALSGEPFDRPQQGTPPTREAW